MEITINYKGVDFDVEFDYQPAERAETGPEAQYPGCGEQVEAINEFKHKGTCFLEFIEYEEEENEIKDLILEKLHEN